MLLWQSKEIYKQNLPKTEAWGVIVKDFESGNVGCPQKRSKKAIGSLY